MLTHAPGRGRGANGFNRFKAGSHTRHTLPDMVKPAFQHQQRSIPFDQVLRQQVEAAFQTRPLLAIHHLVAGSCNQEACFLYFPGSQGMSKRLLQQAIIGKPVAGLCVEDVDGLGAEMTLKLIKEKSLKQVVESKPPVFSIQGNQEQVFPL
jgi:hypothetical protein